MPSFAYIARSRKGEKVEGVLDAPDRRAALARLDQMGCVPVSVSEKTGAAEAPRPEKKAARGAAVPQPADGAGGPRRRMRPREVLTFSTELSDLLAAGMTLGNALNLLANQKTGRAGDAIITQVRDDIIKGSSLSGALAKHPRSFSSLYVSMIRAGEESGQLPEVLRRLVKHYEMLQEVRDKIITALVYPAIVVTLGVVTMLVIVWYVLPKFAPIFEELGSTLPLSTQMLVFISHVMVRYGFFIIGLLVVFSALAWRAVKTEKGRLWWHGFILKLPLVKGVISAGIYSNFARTLATLLSNGVPVLRALGIVEQTIGNAVIAREIRNARDKVTDGTSISGPLASGRVFPKMMTDMLAIGEQTGDVSRALTHVANRYENQLNRSIKILTTALEPILILVIAVMVGFIAVSIVSAVFSLTNGLDKQV